MTRTAALRLEDLAVLLPPLRDALRERNDQAVRRVAAGLPRPDQPHRQGPPTSREAASPARETASTTTTHSGGPSGCTSQSA